MRVRYTATARIEVEEILAHIGGDNASAATAVGAAIKLAVAQLQAFPRLGASTDEPGIFLKIARPYRYLIFYGAIGDTIVIRNVRHPARQHPRVDRS
jgi:plasmid stabilization system protein ParE